MPYQGLLFFYALALMLIPAVVLGLLQKPLRHYGLCFTLVMLAWIFGQNRQLPMLIIFALWQLCLCILYCRLNRVKTRRWMLRVMVALAVLPLAAVKLGDFLPALGGLRLLGVSYMTFRSVQVLLDIHDGRVTELQVGQLAYFLLFFPSVASGPIDRYSRFLEDINRDISREQYTELLRQGFWKLLGGAFSAVAVSGLLWQYWLAPLPADGLLPNLSYMYGYTFYLFFNFAGYSSMAVGTAYILGVTLPENFRMPFLSVDMKDFWTRWHISLSAWLRDYVYSRFVMASLKAKRFKNPRTASYLGYVITMMTMGLWHGPTPTYILYGAYHSVLMCINEALDLHWKPFRKLKRKGAGQVVAVVVTFHLFSFGLLIFSGRLL